MSEAMSYFRYEEKKEVEIIIEKDEECENRAFDDDLPFFRSKHSVVLLEDKNKMLVIGGNCLGVTIGDFWLLDMKTLEWEALELDTSETKIKRGVEGAVAFYV